MHDVDDHPFQSIKFCLRYRLVNKLAMSPRAQISFEARLLRGGEYVEESRTLLSIDDSTMNGNLQSKSAWLGAGSDVVKMARVGDQIGVWVGKSERSWHFEANRHDNPSFEYLPFLEVRRASIECFCRW
jgi:hypothetical protein